MIISLITALSEDYVIGIKNTIPWYLPADLVWFKNHTLNKPIIMGRKTFQSIGKSLPGRKNIVLSRQFNNNLREVTWAETPFSALKKAGLAKEVMIIGGSRIYKIFLLHAKRLYITHINVKCNGDAWFPEYRSDNRWYSVFKEYHCANNKNIYNYCFEILESF